jgi:hypothetical protein
MHPLIDQLLMKTRVADMHEVARRHSFVRAVAVATGERSGKVRE